MEHNGHAFKRALQSLAIANVRADKLGPAVEEFRMVRGMNLRNECIKNSDLVAARDQRIHQMGADESRSTCH
jgi:hypothetical protein